MARLKNLLHILLAGFLVLTLFGIVISADTGPPLTVMTQEQQLPAPDQGMVTTSNDASQSLWSSMKTTIVNLGAATRAAPASLYAAASANTTELAFAAFLVVLTLMAVPRYRRHFLRTLTARAHYFVAFAKGHLDANPVGRTGPIARLFHTSVTPSPANTAVPQARLSALSAT